MGQEVKNTLRTSQGFESFSYDIFKQIITSFYWFTTDKKKNKNRLKTFRRFKNQKKLRTFECFDVLIKKEHLYIYLLERYPELFFSYKFIWICV